MLPGPLSRCAEQTGAAVVTNIDSGDTQSGLTFTYLCTPTPTPTPTSTRDPHEHVHTDADVDPDDHADPDEHASADSTPLPAADLVLTRGLRRTR